MTPIERLKFEIQAFEGVTWANAGEPGGSDDATTPGWVKFALEKTELGWRTLEFLAWVFEDLARAERHVQLFPTSAPPHLNTPGQCLAFAVECYMDDTGEGGTIEEVALYLARQRSQHWDACKP